MIAAIALLVACQALGELIHRAVGLPLPGTVIGVFLLLGWLALWRRERPALDQVAAWLIGNMSVMFLPAAVGLIQQGPLLARYGLVIGLAAAVSTVLTLAVTVTVFRLAQGRAPAAPGVEA